MSLHVKKECVGVLSLKKILFENRKERKKEKPKYQFSKYPWGQLFFLVYSGPKETYTNR